MTLEPLEKPKRQAKFIKPPNTLKLKAGSGGIPPEALREAQMAMDMLEVDFIPIARELLERFSKNLRTVEKQVRAGKEPDRDSIIYPIMQIKANGGMFRYRLLSDVADICLQFLEALDDFNEDTLEIVRAHEKSLRSIVGNDLQGAGGHEGFKLVEELHNACKRYFKKYKN